MASQGITVERFKQILQEQVELAAKRNNLGLEHTVGRGGAFEMVIAEMIDTFEERFDASAEDANVGELGGSGDLGCDLWFEDASRKHLLIVQTKHDNTDSTAKPKQIEDFFGAWRHHLNRKYVAEHGNVDICDRLDDFKERLEAGWSVEYRFVTNAKFNKACISTFEEAREAVSSSGHSIEFDYQDFSDLKDYYLQGLSLARAIPKKAAFNVRDDYFIAAKTKPRQSLVAIVKGNELCNLHKQHKRSLFSFNIRGDLGKNVVNDAITDTALNAPEDFFYFNNGVTALCKSFELENNRVDATDFQIINGAQTVSSLVAADKLSDPLSDKVEVLLRVIVTDSVATTEGFNARVVAANNTQNAVKPSDFRSNDPIQTFLETKLVNSVKSGALPAFYYVPKRQRGTKPKGNKGKGLKLEALAKCRYAYLYNPIDVNKDIGNLFLQKSENTLGKYDLAFGAGGRLEGAWEHDTLVECKFIYAVAEWLSKKTRADAAKTEGLRYLIAMRFHALSLIGKYIRQNRTPTELARLLENESDFEEVLEELYLNAQGSIVKQHANARDDGVSDFSLRQGLTYWNKMEAHFDNLSVAGFKTDAIAKD